MNFFDGLEDELDFEKIEQKLETKRNIKNIWKAPELSKYIKVNKKQRDESIKEFLEQVNTAMEKIKTLVIDRIEGNIAVCENRNTRRNGRY